MIRRYFGWRAGALAMGCALGALLASGPAQAQQCVGDCNGDGMVAINELIIGVNIALGSQPASACPSFDVNGDGMVTINELIQGVNNALNGCPAVNTPTNTIPPIDTPTATATFTIPAGTATATITDTPLPQVDTPTPTVTAVPTAADIGSSVCTLDAPADKSKSLLLLQTAALPLSLVPTGTYSIDCGAPGADGVAPCTCTLLQFGAVVIPAIGDVCINPAAGCAPGHVDCNGGAPSDVNLTADHNVGTCASNAACAATCDAHCATLGQGFARQSFGCEGYCQGGTNDEAECMFDSECTGGQCVGGEPVAHFQTCNCVCAGTDIGDAAVAGGLTCNLGTQINVELPSNGHCGDTATIQLAPVCGNVTSETSTGSVLNANNSAGATIPTAAQGGAPSVIDGVAVSCDNLKAHTLTGLKLVGQLGFFDSTLGDIRSAQTFVCQ
jgi:hypothetical protein